MHVLPCFPSYGTAFEHNLSSFAGYGFRAPNDCWASAWLVVVQSIWGQLLDAIVLGVIFARISHPKQRARTVFMSDSAVIARRDGILKFMFRVGDIRQTQACQHANPNRRSRLCRPACSFSPCCWRPLEATLHGQAVLTCCMFAHGGAAPRILQPAAISMPFARAAATCRLACIAGPDTYIIFMPSHPQAEGPAQPPSNPSPPIELVSSWSAELLAESWGW